MKTIEYEWVLEFINKWDDIVDVRHSDDFAPIWKLYKVWTFPEVSVPDEVSDGEPVRLALALQRRHNYGEDILGYAYVGDDGLEPEFDTEHKVPKKYLAQVAKTLEKK